MNYYPLVTEMTAEMAKQVSRNTLINAIILTTVTAVITGGIGFLVWYIQRKFTLLGDNMVESNKAVALKLASQLEEKNECVDELRLVTLKGVSASLAVGIANGIALRDGKCNGVMKNALEEAYSSIAATDVFIEKLTKKALHDIQN